MKCMFCGFEFPCGAFVCRMTSEASEVWWTNGPPSSRPGWCVQFWRKTVPRRILTNWVSKVKEKLFFYITYFVYILTFKCHFIFAPYITLNVVIPFIHHSLLLCTLARPYVCHSWHISPELLHAFAIPYIPGSLHLSLPKHITPCITTNVCHSLQSSLTLLTCALITLHTGHSRHSSLTMYIHHSIRWLLPLKQVLKKTLNFRKYNGIDQPNSRTLAIFVSRFSNDCFLHKQSMEPPLFGLD